MSSTSAKEVAFATEQQHHHQHDAQINGETGFTAFKRRHRALVPAIQSGAYLLILFLGIQSYFYGSVFRSSARTHALRVLAVDYDQGMVGRALQAAYQHLQSPTFLTLDFRSSSDFPDPARLGEAICGSQYWAVLFTNANASNLLESAIAGNGTNTYAPSDAMTFIYNGVKYPVIGEAYLMQGKAELVAAATQALQVQNGMQLYDAAKSEDAASLQALYRPLDAATVVQYAAPQGTTILLNSFTMIIPPLMQFFFVMALDHISIATKTFARAKPLRLYLFRLGGSMFFSLCGSLCVSGCIWAFRENWKVSGLQYFATWFIFWFYMAISYLVMDSCIGTIVPLRYAPFFIFSFVILNVTSTLYPFELNPGFYRWGWAMPAHNVWWLLMQAWSNGCVSQIDVALPVLFSWWIIGHCTSAVAVWRKCRAARLDTKAADTA